MRSQLVQFPHPILLNLSSDYTSYVAISIIVNREETKQERDYGYLWFVGVGYSEIYMVGLNFGTVVTIWMG